MTAGVGERLDRGASSAKTASATGRAGQESGRPSVQEVALAGEHHRQARARRPAAISSSSRIAPPGCTTTATPARGGRLDAVGERVERVARARRRPRPVRRPCVAAISAESTRFCWPAPMPTAWPSLTSTMALRLHVAADPPGQLGVAPLPLGRGDLRSRPASRRGRSRSGAAPAPGSRPRSGARRARARSGRRRLEQPGVPALARSARRRCRRRRPGAMTTSACGPATIRSTVAGSIGRFNATIAAER